MPRKQKKPTRFKFAPFSEQQRRLMHWWRPPLASSSCDFVVAIRKNDSLYHRISHMVTGNAFGTVVHPCRKDDGSVEEKRDPSYASDS